MLAAAWSADLAFESVSIRRRGLEVVSARHGDRSDGVLPASCRRRWSGASTDSGL